MESPSKIAPLIDWNLPYKEETVAMSLGEGHPDIGIVSLRCNSPNHELFHKNWRVALVEGPEGIWCAWSLQEGSPISWAPSVAPHTEEFSKLCMFQMKRVCPFVMPPVRDEGSLAVFVNKRTNFSTGYHKGASLSGSCQGKWGRSRCQRNLDHRKKKRSPGCHRLCREEETGL